VVDTGPYTLAPSDLILAALATAIQKGTPFALPGAAMVTLAFCIEARREERFLRAEPYARKTAMLVPFVRIEDSVSRHQYDGPEVLAKLLGGPLAKQCFAVETS
jgi:hypothetical protein